jgi:hypothetical protein
MINWDKTDFIKSGFQYTETAISTLHTLKYKGDVLLYEINIDEESEQVSISGDTTQPFSSDSMYEIYARCRLVVFKSSEEIDYRRFHFSFYDSPEPTGKNLLLTVAGRLCDK